LDGNEVKLEYLAMYESPRRHHTATVPKTGPYQWTVPTEHSQTCLVIVSDPEDHDYSDLPAESG